MPRPKEFDYDRTADGRPTSSHIWEEKFFAAGHKGPPPIDDLKKRIVQLKLAITERPNGPIMQGWQLELEWRIRQLELQELTRGKEADRGDSEHQE